MLYLEQAKLWLAVLLVFSLPLSTTGVSICSILLLSLILITLWQNDNLATIKHSFKHPVSIAAVFFILFHLVGSIYSSAELPAIFSAGKKIFRIIYVPLLIPLFQTSAIWRNRALTAFNLALGILIICVYLKMLHIMPVNWFRHSSTESFKDNIFSSLFVAFAIFATAHSLFNSLPNNQINTIKQKIILTVKLITIFAFTHYLFFISPGRSGQVLFIALTAVFLLQLLLQGSSKLSVTTIGSLLLLITTLIVTIAITPNAFKTRITTSWHEASNYLHAVNNSDSLPLAEHESSAGLRLELLLHSIKLNQQRPFWGWGLGAFTKAYNQQFPARSNRGVTIYNPHNQYALIAVELGIIGLICFILFWGYLTSLCWRNAHSADSKILFGLIVSIAVGCLANSWLKDLTSMFFFTIFLAIYGSTVQVRSPNSNL